MAEYARPFWSKMKLKQLISEDKTDEVFEALMELSTKIKDKRIANAIINLSAQFKRFANAAMINTTDQTQQKVTQAGLNNSILQLIDELPEEFFGAMAPERAVDLNYAASGFEIMINKAIMILFIILLFGSVLGFIASVVLFLMNMGSEGEGAGITQYFPLFASIAAFIASILIYIVIIKPQQKK
jgi:hypothetical protein